MSRKSRQRQKPELVPNQPDTVLLTDNPHGTVYRLTGKLHDMLEAIVSGCAIITQTAELADELYREDGFDEEFDDEELDDEELFADGPTEEELAADVSQELEAFGGLAFTIRLLARELLAQALDRQPARSVASFFSTDSGAHEGSDAAVVDKLVEPLLPANLPDEMRPSRSSRREAFGEAAWLLREVGLEEFDVSCHLDTSDDGTPELRAYSLPPESAHVELLEYLFVRAETIVDTFDPVLAAERDASYWEFSQWSVSPPPGHAPVEVTDFAGSVREQEYSLAERRTVTLGTSVMRNLAQSEGLAALCPRQYRIAAALDASFVDVFECVGLDGTRATFRSMRDGRTFQLHEHLQGTVYAPGWIAMGRLFPFDDNLYLRSPGMLFMKPNDRIDLTPAVEAFADARTTLSPALALEAFISSRVFGVPVPRQVKPAISKAEARSALAMLADMLADADLERARNDDVTAVSNQIYYTPGLHDDGGAGDDDGLRLDTTLQAFIAALEEQAARGGGERHEQPRAKKRKGKRRR